MHEKTQQLSMFESGADREPSGPVECLGLVFANDDDRRAYFTELLREKLKDPEFRKIEGFPIGEDEDILALSDPPYYTACPNPFIKDFLDVYGQPFVAEDDNYARQPLTADVAQTRDNIIYGAHTYHTKVPPLAIKKYIEHFTEPGDVVLDAFSGSGMTGTACGLVDAAEQRRVILCDLSPAATFISAVYLCPPSVAAFDKGSRALLARFQSDYGHLWEMELDGTRVNVEYQVWTEIFTCPRCQRPIETTKVIAATKSIGTAQEFACPHCNALVSKAPTKKSGASRLERNLQTRFDQPLNQTVKTLARSPILTQVRNKAKGRQVIETPEEEKSRLDRLQMSDGFWYPTDPLIKGERYLLKDYPPSYGITHIHHLYLPRQLITFGMLWRQATQTEDKRLRRALQFFLTSNGLGFTVLNRYAPTHYSQVNKYFSGTLYIPSTIAETSPTYAYSNKRKRLLKAFGRLEATRLQGFLITTQSSTNLSQIPANSIDYAFVDPPFGRNLQYSELNQIWETWLKIKTNRQTEAVIDSSLDKEILEYTKLMQSVFAEIFRALKPGRWISVVFHNSYNAVWMAIQEALSVSGFVIADVHTLDKKRQTYKQIRQGTVKQDLVIAAYKPGNEFENRFRLDAGTEEGVWDFVRNHLSQLPVFIEGDNNAVEAVAERQDYLLFDRMVAFHVQRGITIPISASEFYMGLSARFSIRDHMYFLSSQVAHYDRMLLTSRKVVQLPLIVTDEASAIQWLKQQLADRPQTFQDLQPRFMQETKGGWLKHEKSLELSELLEENFILFDDQGDVPSQIHSYLSSNYKDLRNLDKDDPALRARAKNRWYVPNPNKQVDLEKLRERRLLREFVEYQQPTKKRLKVFRLEAVRAGFKRAWQEGDYATIIAVARKIPDDVLHEDPKLLMWYDQALTRTGQME